MAYLKNIEEMKENFLSNLHKKKIEHFSEIPGINDIEDSESNEKQNTKEAGLDESEVVESKETGVKINDLVSQDTVDKFNEVLTKMATMNQNTTKSVDGTCKKSNINSEGKCLFGCPEGEVTDTAPAPTHQNRETNMEEMMKTIEETEKMCDLIEVKDKKRKEEEEKESLKKQIELNKNFLIQQKAKNK